MQQVFPGRIVQTDSKTEESAWDAIHYSFYSRYCTKVGFHVCNCWYHCILTFIKAPEDAPPEADPSSLQPPGRPPVKTSQAVPRYSLEGSDYHTERDPLEKALQPMFDWLTEEV